MMCGKPAQVTSVEVSRWSVNRLGFRELRVYSQFLCPWLLGLLPKPRSFSDTGCSALVWTGRELVTECRVNKCRLSDAHTYFWSIRSTSRAQSKVRPDLRRCSRRGSQKTSTFIRCVALYLTLSGSCSHVSKMISIKEKTFGEQWFLGYEISLKAFKFLWLPSLIISWINVEFAHWSRLPGWLNWLKRRFWSSAPC